MSSDKLAILGGRPIRRQPWPTWPESGQSTVRRLADVLSSGRWTVSNPIPPLPVLEQEAGRSVARLYGSDACVLVPSGTAALRLGLLALGVRPLDRVLVPTLTWAAVGAAVVNAGAVPVAVDVEPNSLCMSPEAAARAVAEVGATAIILVHQNCAVADVDAFTRLAATEGIALLEDCSQAHGARIAGRAVGTFGHAGAMSFQQNKLITCGEGGAVVTSDSNVANNLEQLHAMGRTYIHDPTTGSTSLHEQGGLIGDSAVMSEFHAAVLLDQLARFPEQHARRAANISHLEQSLADCDWLTPLTASPEGSERGYHKYVWRIDHDAFAGAKITAIQAALAAELSGEVGLVDASFDRNPLLRSESIADRLLPRHQSGAVLPLGSATPVASAARNSCIHLRHNTFLGNQADVDDVVAAVNKVRRHASSLAKLAGDAPD